MRMIARAGGSLVLADFQVPPLRGSMLACLHATAALPMSPTIDFPCPLRLVTQDTEAIGLGNDSTKLGTMKRKDLIIHEVLV